MTIYCIIYELKNSTYDYSDFYRTLKQFGENSQFMSNGWLISSNSSKDDIYEQLKPKIDNPDLLLITKTDLKDMAGWLPSSSINWLLQQSK